MSLSEDSSGSTDPFDLLLNSFVDLQNRRRDVESELDCIKADLDKIEPQLAEMFGMRGMQNAKIRGLLIYVSTDRYVTKKGGVDTSHVCDVLKDHGLGDMVSLGYSASALKSRVLGWKDEGAEIPEGLAAVLNIGEALRLKTRKA